jgi:hypothetical protein
MAGEMGTVADCQTSCYTKMSKIRGISYVASASASGQEQTVKSVGPVGLGYFGGAVIRHRVVFRYLASGHFVSHSFQICCSLLLGHREIRDTFHAASGRKLRDIVTVTCQVTPCALITDNQARLSVMSYGPGQLIQ